MKSLETQPSSLTCMGLKCKDSMDSPCFAIKKGTPLSPLNHHHNFLKKWGNTSHDGFFTNLMRCKGKQYFWIYQKNHEENSQKRRGTSQMVWGASCFQGECILMVRDRLHLIYKYYKLVIWLVMMYVGPAVMQALHALYISWMIQIIDCRLLLSNSLFCCCQHVL